MSYERYRVSIECLENGYKVEVPDLEKMAAMQKAAKKKNGGADSPCYYGDCTKSFVAKNVKEAIKLVSTALEKIPEADYDSAFEEAAK